ALLRREQKLPAAILAIKLTQHVAEMRFVLGWYDDRDEKSFDGFDRVIPSIRGIGVTSIRRAPRLRQLIARHTLRTCHKITCLLSDRIYASLQTRLCGSPARFAVSEHLLKLIRRTLLPRNLECHVNDV